MSLSMLAAAGGQDDILRLLIKRGVKVNGRQRNGTTALMHAAEKVIIALLLKPFCTCSAAVLLLYTQHRRHLFMSLTNVLVIQGRKKVCNNLVISLSRISSPLWPFFLRQDPV